jgi:hypothetical protein
VAGSEQTFFIFWRSTCQSVPEGKGLKSWGRTVSGAWVSQEDSLGDVVAGGLLARSAHVAGRAGGRAVVHARRPGAAGSIEIELVLKA